MITTILNDVNRVILDKVNYPDTATFYKKIGDMVTMLLEGGKIVLAVNLDDCKSKVLIEYVDDNEDAPKPYWLLPEEADVAETYHMGLELSFHEQRARFLKNELQDKQDNARRTLNKLGLKNGGNDNDGGGFEA